MNEEEVSHIAYFRTDGGSPKLYTQEYVDNKNKEIERLNKELADTKKFKNSILAKLEKRTLERDKLRERLKVEKKKLNERRIKTIWY